MPEEASGTSKHPPTPPTAAGHWPSTRIRASGCAGTLGLLEALGLDRLP